MSKIQCDPYLFFRGNCREAMKFYQSIFGGELFLQTYQESGTSMQGMNDEDIMHAALTADGFMIMASDTPQANERAAKVAISLAGDDEEVLTNYFNGLSEGVDVMYPLKKESWGAVFGSVVDKYGVEWMVNISAKTE